MPRALSTLISLIFLQLSSRLLTFTLNQFVIRLTTPKAYGTASIQFELLSSTVLFLGREGVRNAVLRAKSNSAEAAALSWLPLCLGIPISLASTSLYLHYATENVVSQQWFHEALALYIVSAVVELACEPAHNHSMVNDKTNIRVRAEGLGVTFKTIVTFLVLFWFNDLALLAYAAGQITYSGTLLVVYLNALGFGPWYTANPLSQRGSPLFRLSMTMTLQSIIKHFLTEGDKILLSIFARVEDQGGYAIAANYGSLIARIIFQPIEETLRVYFSKSLPPHDAQSKSTPAQDVSLKESKTTLSLLLQLQLTFSVFFVLFGSTYLNPALSILLPPRYLATSAPQILRAYIFYIPFLSINGGLEAFVSSASSPRDLNRQSSYMVMFSLIYSSTAVILYSESLPFKSPGDASLVYANIVNLSARIIFTIQFTTSYFTSKLSRSSSSSLWISLLPSPFLMGLASGSHTVLRYVLPEVTQFFVVKQPHLRGGKAAIMQLGVGGVFAVLWLGAWWFVEGRNVVKAFRGVMVKGKPGS